MLTWLDSCVPGDGGGPLDLSGGTRLGGTGGRSMMGGGVTLGGGAGTAPHWLSCSRLASAGRSTVGAGTGRAASLGPRLPVGSVQGTNSSSGEGSADCACAVPKASIPSASAASGCMAGESEPCPGARLQRVQVLDQIADLRIRQP